MDESRVWDAHDDYVGLATKPERNLQRPTRVSSVFHWRTLQRLLLWNSSWPATTGFVDAHCHLDRLFNATGHTGCLVDFFCRSGIETHDFTGCIAVFCDEATLRDSERVKELVSDENVFGAVRFHPKNAQNFTQDAEAVIRCLLKHPKICALSEIGLDYARGHDRHTKAQQSVFRRLLGVSVELKVPVVIHCRDAEEDCFKIALESLPRYHHIHLHCYMRNWEGARKWCDAFPNLCVGLTNAVTWGNPGPRSVAQHIPLDRLLLETDAPYFPPRTQETVHFSVPTMAQFVAEEVAHIRDIPKQEVFSHTLKNTEWVYGVKFRT
ncbi:putative deoxyribonuclease TATDN2 [Patiria miniata]|uniref:Uncharacterized protein n=1 Tax=Patiria miniata TaxID=46514 RepID=A0A914A8L9_PATMI|nr:putative deoxyribonuclease TATDN2 [Patiria miniata]